MTADTDQNEQHDLTESNGGQRRWLVWYAAVLLFLVLQIILYSLFTGAFS